MVRLIDVKVDSLDEFKSLVTPLLPPDGMLKCLEVYICKLTAQQLAFLFEILSKNRKDSIENLLFWKVEFLGQDSPLLGYQVEQAVQRLRQMKTFMVYQCSFPNQSIRSALLGFCSEFLENARAI